MSGPRVTEGYVRTFYVDGVSTAGKAEAQLIAEAVKAGAPKEGEKLRGHTALLACQPRIPRMGDDWFVLTVSYHPKALPKPKAVPTAEGMRRYGYGDGHYLGEPCTCDGDCDYRCEGDCGCRACSDAHQDYLSHE